MKPDCFIKAAGLLLAAALNLAEAGMLAGGSWNPAHCGAEPVKPELDDQNVEVFNKSVAAINAWQQQFHVYLECLIKEANADNALIADSANRAQEDFRREVQKVAEQAEKMKKKLDNK